MNRTKSMARILFAWVSTLVGFALSGQSLAQQGVEFPSSSPSKPVTVPADLYRPKGEGPFPAVVVLHSCGGVKSRDNNAASSLQDEGYLAFVLDRSRSDNFN